MNWLFHPCGPSAEPIETDLVGLDIPLAATSGLSNLPPVVRIDVPAMPPNTTVAGIYASFLYPDLPGTWYLTRRRQNELRQFDPWVYEHEPSTIWPATSARIELPPLSPGFRRRFAFQPTGDPVEPNSGLPVLSSLFPNHRVIEHWINPELKFLRVLGPPTQRGAIHVLTIENTTGFTSRDVYELLPDTRRWVFSFPTSGISFGVGAGVNWWLYSLGPNDFGWPMWYSPISWRPPPPGQILGFDGNFRQAYPSDWDTMEPTVLSNSQVYDLEQTHGDLPAVTVTPVWP